MTPLHDDSYVLIGPHHARRRLTSAADLATLRRLERWGPFWAATVFALLAISASILIAAVLATVSRSHGDVFTPFIPGWSWLVTG